MSGVQLDLAAQFDTIYAEAPDNAVWVRIEKADEIGDVLVTYLGRNERVLPNGGPYKVNLIGEKVPVERSAGERDTEAPE